VYKWECTATTCVDAVACQLSGLQLRLVF